MTSPSSGIARIEDLRGKRVAVTRGTDPHIFLLRALASAGLTEKDIEIVPLQHPDGKTALDRAQVDAWAGLDPYMAQLEVDKGFKLFFRHSDWNSLLRLGTPTVAARVHLGAGYWRIVADGQLRLSHEGEQEITDALDLVLRGVVLRRGKRAPVFGLTRTAASNSAATRAAIP